MTGPLPTPAQAVDCAADRPVGDLDRMVILQVLTQEWGRPDRSVITELPRVVIDHCGDSFINGSARCPGAAHSRSVEEPRPEVQLGSFLESAQPVVNRLPADLEQFSDHGDIGSV